LKQLFDQYGARGPRIVLRIPPLMDAALTIYGGEGETFNGDVVLCAVDHVARQIAKEFNLDHHDVLDEMVDFLDATVWSDLFGGINDPVHGKKNRFYEARNDQQ
jgi:hypothetical protein